VNRRPAGIQHWNFDPAQVKAITCGPNHRADAGSVKIKAPKRFGQAGRVWQHDPGSWIFRHVPIAVCGASP